MDATAAPDAAEVPEVDAAQPATTLQIRLHDGRRVRAQLNMHHTVRHIQAIIARFVSSHAGRRPPVASHPVAIVLCMRFYSNSFLASRFLNIFYRRSVSRPSTSDLGMKKSFQQGD